MTSSISPAMNAGLWNSSIFSSTRSRIRECANWLAALQNLSCCWINDCVRRKGGVHHAFCAGWILKPEERWKRIVFYIKMNEKEDVCFFVMSLCFQGLPLLSHFITESIAWMYHHPVIFKKIRDKPVLRTQKIPFACGFQRNAEALVGDPTDSA